MRAKKLPPVGYLRQRLFYEPETGKLYWRLRDDGPVWWNGKFAGREAGSLGVLGYRLVGLESYDGAGGRHKLWPAHRIVWAIVHGEDPPADIDHINHIRDDNRIENLRLTDRSTNCQNGSMRTTNKSGVMGVYWLAVRQKWVATIRVGSKTIFLKQSSDLAVVTAARKAAEIKYGYHENHGKDFGAPKYPNPKHYVKKADRAA